MTRSLNTSLRDSLLKEDSFTYAHLVKFEKPLKTANGKSARRAKDYTYLTDGSFDVAWDDGSKDIQANSNGSQTYIANKIIKVGSTSETTEARASNIALTVSAAALSTSFTDSITITSGTITAASTDFVEAGFREGDVVRLLSGSGANDTARVRIDSFSNNNKTANITALTKISSGEEVSISALTAGSAVSYSVNFASAEVESILNNRSSTGYARYINRDVFIYKAHINKDTGAFIGDPYLLFKGIIASGKISEDPSKQSVVTWSITSHWGDFRQVSGRLTSDDFHRALDGNGNPDRDAVLRPAYAGDLGFLHSESAVNLMAIYQVSETRYREKRRGGLAGAIGLKKLEEYQVEVDREVDLRFNLDAKYLPVVYGVNKIDSIPIFVDSLNTNSKKVYVAYALCEGEIGGLYDVYLDDTNSICLDANDNDTRSSQTDNATVDVLCSGRMDRGDTLLANTVTSGTSSYGSPPSALGATDWAQFQADMAAYYSNAVIGNPNSTFGAGSSSSSAGITHEAGHGFVTPIDAKLIFHSGKPNQKADALLVSQSSNFKVRNDYYTGASDYWGAAHRLLDTAYVVVEYTVGEGETTLPSLDFVVRGKGVECYNYDFSFEQDPDYTSSDAASSAFSIGASVSITATSGGSSLGNSIIADIYNLTNLDGTTSTRIRFLEEPPLTYTDGIPSVTAFKMTSGSNIFHLVAHNNTATSGSVARKLQDTISSVANNSSSGVDLTLSGADSTMQQALATGTELGIYEEDTSFGAEYNLSPELINTYTYSSSGNQAQGVGETTTGSSSLVNKKAFLKDVVVLASSASSTDDAYNNRFIEVTHINSDNTVKVQKRKITDYDGGERVAKVDVPFEEDAIPDTNDTYKIFSVANDVRVSTNPAMQLLDYLTEKRYGRDLLLEDLDLSSFLQSARDCDTRSDVTVVTTAEATVGDVYSVTENSKVLWVGTVKSSTQIESSRYNTVFTNVLGKLAHRWEDWKAFVTGEYYYYKGALHQASADGAISSAPSTTASISSYALSKDSGSGPSSLSLEVSKATSTEGGAGNPVVKVGSTTSSSSGYSLYDADDVKYWRYMGWEAQNQRHVTRHQTNAVINTAKPVFDNVNSMLSHFNGILRYSDGKYSLAIKTASSDPTTITVDGSSYTLGDISDEDIIGQINVEDSGQKGTYNQVSLTINDPQNRFEGRSVVLSNSDYLKEDRRVPKKGSSTTPYVTNYFNARLNAKQYLDDSRAGLKTSFTLGPKGLLLRAGDIIRITYSRFGWTNKLYRVKNLNFQENCLVQVTAEEHNDDGYLIQPKRSNVILPAEPSVANMAAPAAPSGLSTNATDNRGGIILSWTNTSTFNAATYTVQIYRHTSNDRSSAKIVGLSKGDNFTDSITGAGEQTFYYWIRYSVNVPLQRTTGVAPREIFSAYFPTSATGGIAGTAASSIDGASINFAFVRVPHGTTASDVVASATGTQATPANFTVSSVSYTWSDTIPSGTGTLYTVKGSKTPPATGFVWGTPRQLEGDSHAELIIYSDVVASGGSAPADPTACTYNFTTGVLTIAGTNASSWNKIPPSLASAADGSQIFAITVVVSGAPGDTAAAIAAGDWSTDFVYSRYVKGAPGAAGVDAYSVSLTASKYAIAYNIDGGESDTLVFTAAPQGVTGTATYKFEVDGTEKQAAGSATQYTMADSDEPTAGAAKVVKVTLFDDGTEKATDSVSIYGIQDGEDAITVIMTNEAHALPTTAAGAISYTNSGTDIKVFRGSTALNYGSSANQFEVSAAGSNITPNASPSGTGTTRSYGVASACTAATATITFTVTVKNALGTATSFTKIQTFNKTTDGATGEGNEVIYYVSKSAPSTPSASTVAAAVSAGWATAVPTATENVWVSLGSRAAGATNYTWGAPKLLQEVTSNILLNQNMLPWVVGTGDATVPGGTWSQNGVTLENTQSLLTDAFGGQSVIWRAINNDSGSTVGEEADGGFNSPLVAISATQEYRFSILANQKHSNDGTTYFGPRGYNSSNQNLGLEPNTTTDTPNTNPYFFSSDLPALDQWYLIVGHLVPHNDTDETIHPDSGIWSVATGKKVAALNNSDWKFQSTHTQAQIRAYQFYNTSSDADEVQFFAPRIDIADERMPSIQDLLRTAAVPSNTATVFAYQRASADPGTKPSTTRTYTFDTGAFDNSDLGNSWSSTLAGAGSGNNLYTCQAQLTSEAATVSVSTSDWSSASLFTEKGAAGDDAKVVVVTPSTPFFVKSFSAESGGGITTTPDSITITAATSNTTTNGAWSTSAGTLTSIDNSHASPSCVVTSANAVDGMTVTYTLHSDDGGSADSTTLEILDSQDNQITPYLTNEAHVYPASKTGAVSVITGSGTDVQVFEGGDLLDYDGTGTATGKWKVVLDSPTGLTKGAVSSQGSTPSRFARVADHTPATGTDSYSLTHTITGKSSQGKSFSFTKVQTLTKSKTGDDGDDAVSGYLTNESFVAQTAVGGNPNLTGGTGNMKIFLGTTDDTSNWTFAGTATSNGLTCTVTAGTGAYALSGTWTGTTESFNITASRTDYDDVVKTFKVTKVSDGATGAAAYSATVNPGQIYFNEVSGSVVPDGNQLVTFTFTNGTIIHTKSFNYSTDADDNSITSTEVSGGDSEISFDSAAGLAPRTSTTDNQAVRAVHSTSGLKATAIAFYQVVKGT